MAHQQESFHPFSSRQSLSCCLSHVATRNTPKAGGPLSSRLLSSPPKPCGPLSLRLPHLGLNPSASSSAALFPTPPTISYTCQHSGILPALLGCHSKSGQVWPHGMEPVFSKLSRRLCNQGELLPSYLLGGSHSHPPCSKQGHSHLTYL